MVKILSTASAQASAASFPLLDLVDTVPVKMLVHVQSYDFLQEVAKIMHTTAAQSINLFILSDLIGYQLGIICRTTFGISDAYSK